MNLIPRKRPCLSRALALALAVGVAMVGTAMVRPATAQSYPTRPVSIVVPFAAGGPTDTVARNLADAMNKALPGSNFIVENLGGAGGTLGAGKVAKATPDGYTLLLHHIGMATAPTLYRKLSFDPRKDFEYIGLINEVPMTFLAKKDLPPNSIKELLPYLKANASKMTLANAGVGSASHLCGLLFMSTVDQDLTTVPYKGSAPAITDLIGGRIQLMFDSSTSASQMIREGKLRALATATTQRSASFPQLPTIAEAGVPGYQVDWWYGLLAPASQGEAAVAQVAAAVNQALDADEVKKRFAAIHIDPLKTGRAAFRDRLAQDSKAWSGIIQKLGISPE